MKITKDSHCKWKPLHAYHKFKIFALGKDEWDTQEGTGKSMKSIVFTVVWEKEPLRMKQCRTTKK